MWYPHLGRVADSGSQGLEVIGVRTVYGLTPVAVVFWILEVSIEGEPYEQVERLWEFEGLSLGCLIGFLI